MRELELAGSSRVRARVRAAFVTEQLVFDERFRNRGAVERNERSAGSIAQLVHGTRKKFLAGARFAKQQDGRRSPRDLLDELRRARQRSGLTDDAGKVVAARVLLAQEHILGSKAASFERPFDDQHQMPAVDRLLEEVVRAVLHGLHCLVD